MYCVFAVNFLIIIFHIEFVCMEIVRYEQRYDVSLQFAVIQESLIF